MEKFVADVHLGKLARELRMLGFDTLYQNCFSNNQLVQIAGEGERILLSRNVAFSKLDGLQSLAGGLWLFSGVYNRNRRNGALHGNFRAMKKLRYSITLRTLKENFWQANRDHLIRFITPHTKRDRLIIEVNVRRV